jgi:hypothetical protein
MSIRVRIAPLELALLGLFMMAVQAASPELPVSREDFVKAMAKIKDGMPEKEVHSILGPPDDIRTQFDPGGIRRYRTKEVWGYGTLGHLGFPTLGCVFFGTNGQAQYSYGGSGQPPSHDLFSEEQLRSLLRVIDTAPGDVDPYDPLALIKVVNTLQPLGKEKALAAIDEYLRVADEYSDARIGLFWVLRVLFDIPEGKGAMPSMIEGTPSPLLPRSPVWIGHDIPLLLTSWLGGSVRNPVEEQVEYFRQNGLLRSEPLRPTDDPLSILDDVMNSWQSTYKDVYGAKDNERLRLIEQLLQLIDSVYRLPKDLEGYRLHYQKKQEVDARWETFVRDVSLLKIRWDPQQNLYVWNDGSHLPPLPVKQYRRAIWKLEGLGLEAELILERRNETWVDFTLNRMETKGAILRPATLILYDNQNRSKPLQTFHFTKSVGDDMGSSEGGRLRLQEGNEASAQLIFEGATNFSPIFKP